MDRFKKTTTFKGEITEMNGPVFETHREKIKRGRFQDTLNIIKKYSSTNFKQDIIYLTPSFLHLKELEVPKPPDPVETKVKDDKGNDTV